MWTGKEKVEMCQENLGGWIGRVCVYSFLIVGATLDLHLKKCKKKKRPWHSLPILLSTPFPPNFELCEDLSKTIEKHPVTILVKRVGQVF